jgi:hypothetical protein
MDADERRIFPREVAADEGNGLGPVAGIREDDRLERPDAGRKTCVAQAPDALVRDALLSETDPTADMGVDPFSGACPSPTALVRRSGRFLRSLPGVRGLSVTEQTTYAGSPRGNGARPILTSVAGRGA